MVGTNRPNQAAAGSANQAAAGGANQAAAGGGAPGVDNAALVAALAGLTAVVQGLQQNSGGANAVTVAVPVLNPFRANEAFDLASRAGSNAYITACIALDEKWDGSMEKFPSFLIALRVRANEVNWGANLPQGILTFVVTGEDKNLLRDYHSITEAIIKAARVAQNDDRAIQNSRAMYKCLKSSIEGDLRSTLFSQEGNLPVHEDGPTLFKLLTTFTMASSLQLSMLSFNNILQFDPAEYSFNIPIINTKLTHLFVLATTQQRSLSQLERIQHTLAAYARILQAEVWAQWVRNQVDSFEDGRIINCQDFMNSASIKYAKIVQANSGFNGSTTTLQEAIVAIVAAAKRKQSATPGGDKMKTKGDDGTKKQPPFLKHFKTSSAPDATPFKVGDSKEFNGEMWYFCDCPNHREKIKWHTHTAASCRTCQKWIANQGTTTTPTIAQIGEDSGT